MKPNIRFSKFSRRWELHKLTDMVSLYRGLTYTPSDVCNAGTLVLRSSNVQDGEICLSDNVYVNSNIVNTQNVNIGDIIVVVRNGSRSLIGKHAQIKYEMPNTVIGAFMTGICSNAPSFINSLLSSNRFDEEVEKNLGATINQITNGTFNSMKFYFPNRDEQFAIGTYFDNIDAKLQASAKKVEALKKLKAASLISMFPQNGESTPKVRFKGFEGGWSKVILSECLEISESRNIDNLYSKDDVLSVSDDFGVMNQIELLGRSYAGKDVSGYGVLQKGEIVYTKSPLKDKPFGIIKQNTYQTGIVSVLYAIYRVKEGVAADYIHYYFDPAWRLNSYMRPLVNKGAKNTMNISDEMALNGIISIPSDIKEQHTIASFFRTLDRKIALETARLEKLKQIKSACLDKMFV